MGSLLAGYDLAATNSTAMVADNNGVIYTANGPTSGRILYQAGLNYDIQLVDNVKLRLNYNFMHRNDGYNNNMGGINIIIPLDITKKSQ
jgi:hypothetical protein